MKNSSNEMTYYNRKMKCDFVEKLTKDYPWLISFVKEHDCLDFQTGYNPKTKRSWLSIYRGTGRILTFISSKKGISCDAANKYKEFCPEFFKMPTKEKFEKYLDEIKEKNVFKRYYNDEENKRNEGYFQNLVGRRYTFQITEKDDFIIIDKEFVLGFENESMKKSWNKEIINDVAQKIEDFRSQYKGRLPKDIKKEYGEFDFLALNSNGDILIMELKQNDPSKTALSPIQVYFYYKQFKKLLEEDQELYKKIKDMVEQKRNIGIISPIFDEKNKKFPDKLSGKIVPCVIIGENKRLSNEIRERYEFAKKIFLPELETYICEKDGTIKKTDNARCIDR